jgi:MraZ protein
MFRGIHAINLDPKGRLAVPTRYRDRLQLDASGQLVLTIDTDAACLLLYPLPEWEVIEAKIQALPSFNPQARRIQRLLIGHATELELDGSGRILLPSLLREHAKLDKKVMLVGQGKKFELWSETTWNESRETWLADVSSSPDSMPEEMKELSL